MKFSGLWPIFYVIQEALKFLLTSATILEYLLQQLTFYRIILSYFITKGNSSLSGRAKIFAE